MTAAEHETGETREFKGNGTGQLRVPGLTELTAIRVGPTRIPLRLDVKVPLNTHFDTKIHTDIPMVATSEDADECKVIHRGIQSNDGIWQEGAPIFVTGTWDDAHPRMSEWIDRTYAADRAAFEQHRLREKNDQRRQKAETDDAHQSEIELLKAQIAALTAAKAPEAPKAPEKPAEKAKG